jgi:CRP/FNR family transcriptional regulator, cyclic AMP receptor protein
MNNIESLQEQEHSYDGSKPYSPKKALFSDVRFKNVSFLQSLSETAFAAMMEKAKVRRYRKNTLIIPKGAEGNALYIILSGKVRVFSCNEAQSKEFILRIQEPGSCFGEIALLTNEPGLVSVSTLEDTVCAVLSKDDFFVWLGCYPDVAINLLSTLSLRIIQLTKKVKQMALLNVYERTIKVLKDLAIEEGGLKVIHNRPSQQFLASMVGASREMISKIIADLTKGGYVEVGDKTLVINKKLPASW